jgi:citrate lyase beta subunit
MSKISYIELGGTLFVPAVHKNLDAIVNKQKYPNLKSVVIDTEDGIKSSDFEEAYKAIEDILHDFTKSKLLVFIRPRDTKFLKKLLDLKNIEKIDGFLLAKFSLLNANEYFNLLKGSHFSIMPSIETQELFNYNQLYELKDIIVTNKEKIIVVRYGLEDMLKELGIQRDSQKGVFDLSATASVLGHFIATFKSAGFAVSGGVYPYFQDEVGFIKDVQRDLAEGLFSKTIIHPSQISIINELYKVSDKKYQEALKITQEEDGIFAQNGKMIEVKTMSPYAKEIILRAKEYGVLPLP